MYTISYDSGNHMLTITADGTEIAKVYHIKTALRVIHTDDRTADLEIKITEAASRFVADHYER